MEEFEDAYVDAKRALGKSSCPGTLWNAHEILGHCHAKLKKFIEAEAYFNKALESLKKSNTSNTERAAVAGRISQVLRMVKEENLPKNRRKEAERKQDERRNKRKETKGQGDADKTKATEDKTEKKNVTYKVPKVSHGKHHQMTSASAAVRVVVTETRGRAVIANKDIKPGW